MPVKLTGTVVPRVPVVGLIPVRIGPSTVNVTALLVPPIVVMVTFLAVVAAVAVIEKVAVTDVSLTTVRLVTPTPPPGTVIAVAPVSPVPVRVTVMAAPPRTPELGAIEVSVGTGGGITVNVTALLVPLGVVTVTFLADNAAVAAIVKVAVTVLESTTVTPETAMFPPDTVTAVAPIRFAPVRVTGTILPRTPVAGVMEVRVGGVLRYSTAPISIAVPATSGLGLPKKSVFGAAVKFGDVTGIWSITGEPTAGA